MDQHYTLFDLYMNLFVSFSFYSSHYRYWITNKSKHLQDTCLQEAKELKEWLVGQGTQESMGPLASEVFWDLLGPVANQDHLDHLDHQDLQDSLAFLEKWEIMCVFL